MFLVLGQPRSGTTLVAQCLGAHPDLVLPDETDVVVPVAFLCERVPDPEVGRRLAADLIVSTARFPDTLGRHVDPDDVRDAVAAAPWSATGVLGAVYDLVADAAGARHAGDKSPNDHKYARVLANTGLFDGAVPVVHVVRDVRDVAASYDDLGWVAGFHPNMPRWWEVNNLFVDETVPARGGPYHLLRYEDLVADPEAACRGLCAFLDVDWDPVMLDDEARYAQFPGHAGIGQHDRTFQPITDEAVGRYRERFDPETVAAVERLAEGGMERFGYDRAGPE